MASSCTSRATLVAMTDRPQRRLGSLRRSTGAVTDSRTHGQPRDEAPEDASDDTPASRSRPRRSTVWRVATPLVGLLVGVLFVVSAHSSQGTDLRPGRFTDLASMVANDAAQVDALKKHVGQV